MVTVPGDQNNNPNLVGGSGQDDIFGEGGDDRLSGLGSNDELFGGNGNDILEGGAGNDILRGQNGADELKGGGGNDDLFALGDSRGRFDRLQDELSEAAEIPGRDGETITPIPPADIPAPDTLTGGEGNDLFYIQQTAEDEGFGFFPGQQYAIITDFGNEEGNDDQIRLPGSDDNYIARGIDIDGNGNNESTAIIYTEDPNFEIGVGAPIPIGDVSAGRSFDVNAEDALVAIVEDASIRSLNNDNFYTFG